MRTRQYLLTIPLATILCICGGTTAQAELTVAEAQAFHAYIKEAAQENFFACCFNGFPDWRPQGLEPAIPRQPGWDFCTTDPADGDHSRIVLTIALAPTSDEPPAGYLFTWREYDVVILRQFDGESPFGDTADDVIASLQALSKSDAE